MVDKALHRKLNIDHHKPHALITKQPVIFSRTVNPFCFYLQTIYFIKPERIRTKVMPFCASFC